MADFVKIGSFVGPGEEACAKYLQEHLPAHWTVISGIQIPTQKREDIDFPVIAENKIFLIEEKYWGPTIFLDEPNWLVGNDPRQSPVYGISHKAKVLQSYLKQKFPRAAVNNQKPTIGAIVLSHPNLGLKGVRHSSDLIFRLSEVSDSLINLDTQQKTELHLIRNSIIETLSGLPSRPTQIQRIGGFNVLKEGKESPTSTRFEAEHYITGAPAVLTCFHRDIGSDSSPEFNRELLSVTKLNNLQRTWPTSDPFEFEPKNWIVLASYRPAGAQNLLSIYPKARINELVKPAPDVVDIYEIESTKAELSYDESLNIIVDAFAGLSEIHSSGIIHRSLTPSRIWLGKARRVLFSDFSTARLEDQGTLHFQDVNESIDWIGFAAPEVVKDPHAASPSSDVYSLALIFAHWLHNFESDSSLAEIRSKLLEDGQLGQALIPALHESPGKRPSSSSVFESLKAITSKQSEEHDDAETAETDLSIGSEFHEGARIGKYSLTRQLAFNPGISSTWLARDSVENEKPVVIKQFLSQRKFESAKHAIPILTLINHERAQRLITTFDEPGLGFSVSQHFDGETLRSRAEAQPLSFTQIKKIASEAFRFLYEGFHSKSIIHGDISPSNLLLDSDDSVHFIDIELAAQFESKLSGYTRPYAAPEAMDQEVLATPAMDIYSLATSLIYTMLGRFPYISRTIGEPQNNGLLPPTDNEIAQWGPDGEALLKVLFRCVDPEHKKRLVGSLEISKKLARAKGLAPEQQPEVGAIDQTNLHVDEIRRLNIESVLGNDNMLANDSAFSHETYIPTRLDSELLPLILNGEFELVIFTGNPGDGKTSFLQTVGKELSGQGGSFLRTDNGGWRILLEEKSFSAIFDASESFKEFSSDERIAEALIATPSSTSHTVLIAMNDGRLAEFVESNGEQFEELEIAYENYLLNSGSESSGVVIVDMKQRSLVDGSGKGLASLVTQSLTSTELWEDSNCSDCASAGQCPIFSNVKKLRTTAETGLVELVTMSHLAAGRRATVRDFRSALSWLITADLGCQNVHEARANEEDLSSDPSFQLWNLAFDATAGDKLITEWSGFDPSKFVSPKIVRALSEVDSNVYEEFTEDEIIPQLARQAFWGEFTSENIHPRDLNLYRHFSEVLSFLATGEGGNVLLEKLLVGMSRLAGAHGFNENALAISEPALSSEISVIKVLESELFELDSPLSDQGQNLLESLKDKISLRFVPSNLTFNISIDTAEIILRSYDGEIFKDAQSEAIRQSISSFTNKLLGESKKQALLVNAVGNIHKVTLNGDLIELENKK